MDFPYIFYIYIYIYVPALSSRGPTPPPRVGGGGGPPPPVDFGPSGGLWLRSSVLGPQPSFPQSPCHDPALVSWIVSIYLYMIRCCTEHLAIEVMYLVKTCVAFLILQIFFVAFLFFAFFISTSFVYTDFLYLLLISSPMVSTQLFACLPNRICSNQLHPWCLSRIVQVHDPSAALTIQTYGLRCGSTDEMKRHPLVCVGPQCRRHPPVHGGP